MPCADHAPARLAPKLAKDCEHLWHPQNIREEQDEARRKARKAIRLQVLSTDPLGRNQDREHRFLIRINLVIYVFDWFSKNYGKSIEKFVVF